MGTTRYFFDEAGLVYEMADERGRYVQVPADAPVPNIPSVDWVRDQGEQLQIASDALRNLPLKALVCGEWMMPDGDEFIRTHQSVKTFTCPSCKAGPGTLCRSSQGAFKGCHAVRRDLWTDARRKQRKEGKK